MKEQKQYTLAQIKKAFFKWEFIFKKDNRSMDITWYNFRMDLNDTQRSVKKKRRS